MDGMGSITCARRARLLAAIATLLAADIAVAADGGKVSPLANIAPVVQSRSGRTFGADVATRCLIPVAPFADDTAQRTSAPAALHALPPAPNSIVMGLGALGCIGAVQLTRSMKRLHWGGLPDWYHAGAPPRIGHIKVLELDAIDLEPVFGLVALSTSRFERPWLDAREIPPAPLIPTRAPRSPPAAALCA